jgi:RNA polymerase sigma-32 factor
MGKGSAMAVIDSADLQKVTREFMRGAMRQPMLTPEREAALARAWRDEKDVKALHGLATSHFRLVVSQAAKYARRHGLSFADLLQEGHVGLMQAAARFDVDRGVRFSTYAVWWIRAAIQDFVLRNWSVVRLGTTTAEKRLFFNLRRLRARIAGDPGAELAQAHSEELARVLDVTPAAVSLMASRLAGHDLSIHAPVDAEVTTNWSDMLADDRPSPEEVAAERGEARSRRQWLARALAQLPPREAMILRQRYLREQALTLQELGDTLGVSKERVRQLEKRALHRLRLAVPQNQEEGATSAI